MRVLVTGAHGFAGPAVLRQLAATGHQVRALPRGLDVRDRAALRGATAGVDAVCHLAALTRVRESFTRPADYDSVNRGGTEALLDCLPAHTTVVLASTAAVYGTPEHQPIDETTAPAPTSPYAVSKLAAEQALRERATAGALRGITLRCFNVAGTPDPDPDSTRIIPRALAVAAGRHPCLELNGDGSAVRDFVHIDDLARAYALALAPGTETPYRVYNVGATAASVREIIAAVERVTGRPVPLRHRPPQPEPARLVADTTRLTRELGWHPVCSDLDRLVQDTWSEGPV